jgi:large subunit ribosomal protein L29
MKTAQLRELTMEELGDRLDEVKKELFDIRVRSNISPVENPMRLRALRREVARINTLLGEREGK